MNPTPVADLRKEIILSNYTYEKNSRDATEWRQKTGEMLVILSAFAFFGPGLISAYVFSAFVITAASALYATAMYIAACVIIFGHQSAAEKTFTQRKELQDRLRSNEHFSFSHLQTLLQSNVINQNEAEEILSRDLNLTYKQFLMRHGKQSLNLLSLPFKERLKERYIEYLQTDPSDNDLGETNALFGVTKEKVKEIAMSAFLAKNNSTTEFFERFSDQTKESLDPKIKNQLKMPLLHKMAEEPPDAPINPELTSLGASAWELKSAEISRFAKFLRAQKEIDKQNKYADFLTKYTPEDITRPNFGLPQWLFNEAIQHFVEQQITRFLKGEIEFSELTRFYPNNFKKYVEENPQIKDQLKQKLPEEVSLIPQTQAILSEQETNKGYELQQEIEKGQKLLSSCADSIKACDLAIKERAEILEQLRGDFERQTELEAEIKTLNEQLEQHKICFNEETEKLKQMKANKNKIVA